MLKVENNKSLSRDSQCRDGQKRNNTRLDLLNIVNICVRIVETFASIIASILFCYMRLLVNHTLKLNIHYSKNLCFIVGFIVVNTKKEQ